MSFSNAKYLILVLLLSVMQATFSKNALLKKASANDFSGFWALTKEWSSIFGDSQKLAAQIRSDLAQNGITPAKSWEKEMTALFRQNPKFTDKRWVDYWIVKIGNRGKNVSEKEAQIDVQNGIVTLNFFEMNKQNYKIGTSKYAKKVRELVERLSKTDNTNLRLTKEYFQKADSDKSGNISPVEFKAFFSPIIPKGVNVQKLFNEFDHDKNGTLSAEETGHVMGKILSLNISNYHRV